MINMIGGGDGKKMMIAWIAALVIIFLVVYGFYTGVLLSDKYGVEDEQKSTNIGWLLAISAVTFMIAGALTILTESTGPLIGAVVFLLVSIMIDFIVGGMVGTTYTENGIVDTSILKQYYMAGAADEGDSSAFARPSFRMDKFARR
jgi:hypothetical protein